MQTPPSTCSSFRLLGLEQGTCRSTRAVKKAYRQAARSAHPDKQNGSEDQFIALHSAYEDCLNYVIQRQQGRGTPTLSDATEQPHEQDPKRHQANKKKRSISEVRKTYEEVCNELDKESDEEAAKELDRIIETLLLQMENRSTMESVWETARVAPFFVSEIVAAFQSKERDSHSTLYLADYLQQRDEERLTAIQNETTELRKQFVEWLETERPDSESLAREIYTCWKPALLWSDLIEWSTGTPYQGSVQALATRHYESVQHSRASQQKQWAAQIIEAYPRTTAIRQTVAEIQYPSDREAVLELLPNQIRQRLLAIEQGEDHNEDMLSVCFSQYSHASRRAMSPLLLRSGTISPLTMGTLSPNPYQQQQHLLRHENMTTPSPLPMLEMEPTPPGCSAFKPVCKQDAAANTGLTNEAVCSICPIM